MTSYEAGASVPALCRCVHGFGWWNDEKGRSTGGHATTKFNPRCPDGWLPRAGSEWCYRFYEKALPPSPFPYLRTDAPTLPVQVKYAWKEAESYCVAQGGTLVTIKEDNERIFLGENAAGTAYHIGLSSSHRVGEWDWVDSGKPASLSHVQWAPGQPASQSRLPNCAYFDATVSKLFDTPCDSFQMNFICKRSISCPSFPSP